jgi:hypothetical protein
MCEERRWLQLPKLAPISGRMFLQPPIWRVRVTTSATFGRKRLATSLSFVAVGVALVVGLGQWFASTAGRGVAEQMGRIGRADIRIVRLAPGSIVSLQGVAVAKLDQMQVLEPPADSASSPLIYVRGTWSSALWARSIGEDSTFVGIAAPPFTVDHPWNIRLERKST